MGKSTLFKIILGQLEASHGEADYPEDWSVGYMAQEVEATDRSALDFVIDGHRLLRDIEARIEVTEDPEKQATLYSQYDDLGGYQAHARAGEILHGLGFGAQEQREPYRSFSGGWRIRLNLAQALMAPSDLLLLDEPTNHLDLEAILWLENWLTAFPGALLIIAHDREFLDSLVGTVLHLAGHGARRYTGNYSSFERQRAEELEREKAAVAKQQAQVKHIQSFVDRFRAKESKAKQVQSRIKALERMQMHAALHVDADYRVAFRDPKKVSNPIVNFRDLTLGYGDQVVLKNVGQTILPGARIGVLGANGAGKSTLLKAIVGDLEPVAGQMQRGEHGKIGYFAQHQLESLVTSQSAFYTMMSHYEQLTEQQCRDYLGGWGFSLPMTVRPIKSLSGGEKARFVLALLAADQPALLVLDEPTNHLDLDMRDALAVALGAYQGAVIVVAHDRSLLEKIVDELWLVENQTLSLYQGDLADYTAARQKLDSNTKTPGAEGASKKEQRQERAKTRASLANLRKQVKEGDKRIERLNLELNDLEVTLADKKTYDEMPTDQLNGLLAKSGSLRAELAEAEEAWLEASAALEAALA